MKFLRTAFHLQCKIEKGSNIKHIVMKFNPYETAAIPYLKVSCFCDFQICHFRSICIILRKWKCSLQLFETIFFYIDF